MLRESYRVLAPNGRIGGYVIHTAAGLDDTQQQRAAELGPSQVNAPASPERLALQAGFRVISGRDVTSDFHDTCAALLRAREKHAEQLRIEEGDEAFEIELDRKAKMLRGIESGLLRRSLLFAAKP